MHTAWPGRGQSQPGVQKRLDVDRGTRAYCRGSRSRVDHDLQRRATQLGAIEAQGQRECAALPAAGAA